MSAHARQLHVEGDRLLVPAGAFDHAGFRAWVTSEDFPSGRTFELARERNRAGRYVYRLIAT